MADRVNFADPEFEPTDEQLKRLVKEAFAGVREAHEAALRRLREEIELERKKVLRRLEKGSP